MVKQSKKRRTAPAKRAPRKGSPFLLKAADMAKLQEKGAHPWNPNSELIGVRMGAALGLKRTGVSFVRVPVGKESFVPHAHACEEEWVYVLYGQGVAWIDGAEHEIGPGDFMAFPTPSVAHHLRNSGYEDLVYLMGGEHREVEIADFPTLGRRMVRVGADVTIDDRAAGQPFGMAPRAPAKAKRKTKR